MSPANRRLIKALNLGRKCAERFERAFAELDELRAIEGSSELVDRIHDQIAADVERTATTLAHGRLNTFPRS